MAEFDSNYYEKKYLKYKKKYLELVGGRLHEQIWQGKIEGSNEWKDIDIDALRYELGNKLDNIQYSYLSPEQLTVKRYIEIKNIYTGEQIELENKLKKSPDELSPEERSKIETRLKLVLQNKQNKQKQSRLLNELELEREKNLSSEIQSLLQFTQPSDEQSNLLFKQTPQIRDSIRLKLKNDLLKLCPNCKEFRKIIFIEKNDNVSDTWQMCSDSENKIWTDCLPEKNLELKTKTSMLKLETKSTNASSPLYYYISDINNRFSKATVKFRKFYAIPKPDMYKSSNSISKMYGLVGLGEYLKSKQDGYRMYKP